MKQLDESPLISVIVPIYRVEVYLEKCINSILNQTYKNLEVILVDDGSDDTCPEICDRYAEKDSRVKVIHKQNGGVASARNAGLMSCHGEYITYIDPDDWALEDMLMTLYRLIVAREADIVQCGAMDNLHPDKGGNVCEYAVKREHMWDSVIQSRISVVLWGKLYKKEIWDGLIFEEGIVFEDALILPKLLERCGKYLVTTDKLYWYTRRSDGIVRQRKSQLHMVSKERVIYEYEKYFVDAGLMQTKGSFYLCEMIPGYRNAVFSGTDIDRERIKNHNYDMHMVFMKYYKQAKKTVYYRKMQIVKKIEWGLYIISPRLSYWMVAVYKALVSRPERKVSND